MPNSSVLKGVSADESNNQSSTSTLAPFRFRSPGEHLDLALEQHAWVWEGYLARGALTVLGAREKAGKSSLTWALTAALLSGRDFCGRPTSPTPVVVLTEEPPPSVAEKLERFGIAPDAPLSILTRADVRGRPEWSAVVAAAGAEAERLGAGIIVIDPLAFWAALPPDAENSAGAMTEALRPLLGLAGRGLAVLALHHVDNAHGELRGSTAIGAAADGGGGARSGGSVASGGEFDSSAGPGYRTDETEASHHGGRPPHGVGDDPAAQAQLRDTVWRRAERLRWPRIAVTPIWVVHGPAGWQGFRMVAERQELWWAAWQTLQALVEQAARAEGAPRLARAAGRG